MLTGRLPIDASDCPLPEAARRIAETEPARLGDYDRRLRGDLETVVARAVARDPTRRYATPAELAADLRRFLAGEPVGARRDSLTYRLRRRAARHRVSLRVAASVALALAGILAAYVAGRHSPTGGGPKATNPPGEAAAGEAAAGEAAVERGRLLAAAGDRLAAEDVLWPQFLRQPDSPRARLALWELLATPPPRPAATTRGAASAFATAAAFRDAGTGAPAAFVGAVAADDGSVRVWEPASGETRFARRTPLGVVSVLRFDASASRLLAGGAGGLALLDARDGPRRVPLRIRPPPPDRRRSVPGRAVGRRRLRRWRHARCWEAPAGALGVTLPGGRGPARCVPLRPRRRPGGGGFRHR